MTMQKIRYSYFFDFHTMATLPSVGEHFDAEGLSGQLCECGVDFLTFHARCNQGNAYYPTKVGIPHPGLQRDIVGALAAACHRHGIQFSVYFNAHLSDQELLEHPQWQEQNATPPDCHRDGPFYRKACYNSGFGEHLLSMAKELLTSYPIDGFFFDCLGASDCICPACRAKMTAEGLNPDDETHRRQFSDASAYALAHRLHDELSNLKPDLRFFFNGRPFEHMIGVDTQWEAECLPTAPWGAGYEQLPVMAHFLRTMDPQNQVLNMTGRFNDWGDFGSLRTAESLEYDLFYGVANGMRPDIGDHLPPDGRWPEPVFQRVKQVYQKLQQYDPWTLDAVNRPEVAVVTPDANPFRYYPNSPAVFAAVRMLTELKVQFNLVTTDSSWDNYSLLIFPDQVSFTPEIAQRVRKHLSSGRKVLATGSSGLTPDGTSFTLDEEWPAVYRGTLAHSPLYFMPRGSFARDLPEMPLDIHADGVAVSPQPDAEVCMRCVKPYLNGGWDGIRTNFYTPPQAETDEPFILQNKNVIYFSAKLFSGYHKASLRETRLLLRNALEALIPQPDLKTWNLPSFARAFLQYTPRDSALVHILTYCPERRLACTQIEDAPAVLDAKIAIRLNGRHAKYVKLLPCGTNLPFSQENDYAIAVLPPIKGYALVEVAMGK